MKNFVSIQLLIGLILLGVREIPARGLNQAIANYRQPRASTVTVTVLSTCNITFLLFNYFNALEKKQEILYFISYFVCGHDLSFDNKVYLLYTQRG
jgi:hypothetical protein